MANSRYPFSLSVQLPDLPFPVAYYVRFVQNGQNEFLDIPHRMPANLDYKFEKLDGYTYRVTIPAADLRRGFQFKWFAVCDASHAHSALDRFAGYFDYSTATFFDQVKHMNYKYAEKAIPLIDITRANPEEPNLRRVWFILPDYREYITREKFINNYYYP